jgi:hypothetical protein
MIFKSKKRAKPVDGVADLMDVSRTVACGGKSVACGGKSREWLAWWRSAQTVSRAWNEWLAADSSRRPGIYRRYLSALAAEERAAAELERLSHCV